MAAVVATDLWDDVQWDLLTGRFLDVVRKAGALSLLPSRFASRSVFDTMSGDLAGSASLVAESRWVAEVTGGENTLTPMPEALLAAMRGHETAEQLIHDTLQDSTTRGQGAGVNMMHTARALLGNGLGRYEDALAAAREAAADPLEIGPPKWALAEAVEAAQRPRRPGGQRARATVGHDPRQRYGLRIGDRGGEGALLRDDRTAEGLYQEAIERLRRTRIRVELARTRLLYGEWLRRQGRRADARSQLEPPTRPSPRWEPQAFADRAGTRYCATGETVRKRSVETRSQLTAQEAHIGGSSPEGRPIPRSPRRCTSAREPSSGTCARSSRSSESRAGDSCDGCVTATRPCEA